MFCCAIARAEEAVGSPEASVLLSSVCILTVHPSSRSELYNAHVLPVYLLSWERMLHGFVGQKDGYGGWATSNRGKAGVDEVSLGSGNGLS